MGTVGTSRAETSPAFEQALGRALQANGTAPILANPVKKPVSDKSASPFESTARLRDTLQPFAGLVLSQPPGMQPQDDPLAGFKPLELGNNQ